MARVKIEDAERFGSGMNAFFQLKDDGDVEKVRVMYETLDDVDAYSLHRVQVGNSERYVSCLRESPDDPLDDCPLCKAGNRTLVKLFIPLYCIEDGTVKLWERGKSIIKRLQSLFSRYNPLCGTILEIERNGKQGDNQTSYSFYPCDTEEKLTLDDLPEVPPVIGSYVLDKNKEELEEYIATGKMPGEAAASNNKNRNVEEDGVVRRRGASTRTTRRRGEGF